MRIEYLQISNILSFKHYANIIDSPKITFDDGLNILIGQNGAGKSTALEVINFIFKKVIFVPYDTNLDLYSRKDTIVLVDRKQTLQPFNHNQHVHGFRLEPNWSSESEDQKIVIEITLDEIDKRNLELLNHSKSKLIQASGLYSGFNTLNFEYAKERFLIEITINNSDKTFSFTTPDQADAGFQYLQMYDFYRQLIEIYNQDNGQDQLPNLQESFTLISGYRNYNVFNASISLSNEAAGQMREIRKQESSRSTNSGEQSEPSIFNLVRLRIAEKHFDLIFTDKSDAEATRIANAESFLISINEKLALINLRVEIKLVKKSTWAYTFHFYDIKRERILTDINSLSAGQKAIIHLIFEAYGRGKLKGGVVIIDEPEIHLHYQFQYEYLKIIEKINAEQKGQYILVTHSEALISSKTIDKVKRFSLDEDNFTTIKSPALQADQKTLIKILDNTRSTYAFFARKVVLVEGDTDRYFFKSVFQELKPELNQEIAIIDIGGKGNFANWRKFFEDFGLKVYFIGDFDNVFSLSLPNAGLIVSKEEDAQIQHNLKQTKLDGLLELDKVNLKNSYDRMIADETFLSQPKDILWKSLIEQYRNISFVPRKDVVQEIKRVRVDIDAKIDQLYASQIFILKNGAIEDYTNTQRKDLNAMISFCHGIRPWVSTANSNAQEIKFIVDEISR